MLKSRLSSSLVLLVFGILLIITSVVITNQTNSYSETTGTIVKIESQYNSADENYDYTVIVDYTVDGVDYEGELGYYESGMSEGQEVTVFYNPSDPTEIAGDSHTFMVILLVVGILMIIWSIFRFIRI